MREIKEDLCYVAFDYEKENKLALETTLVDKEYTLPNGQTIRVGNERFKAASREIAAIFHSIWVKATLRLQHPPMWKGGMLSDQQAIQFMLADSVTELWAARLMLYETANAHDRNDDLKSLHYRCSAVKLFASEMANKVVDRVVQIFGGRGYMREFAAERFYRELRVDRIWEGTSEIQRIIIAQGLIKKGLQDL